MTSTGESLSDLPNALREVMGKCSGSSLLAILKLKQELDDTKVLLSEKAEENQRLQELLKSETTQKTIATLESNISTAECFISENRIHDGSLPLYNDLLVTTNGEIMRLKESQGKIGCNQRGASAISTKISSEPERTYAASVMSLQEDAAALENEIQKLRGKNGTPITQCPALLERSIYEIALSPQGRTSMAIQLSNYLKGPLTDAKFVMRYHSNERTYTAPVIDGLSSKALFLASHTGTLSYMVSYKISGTGLMLLISFEVVSQGGSYVGLALAPQDVKVNKELLNCVWEFQNSMRKNWRKHYEVLRPDKKRDDGSGDGGHLTVSSGNLRAKAILTGGRKACMRVDVWQKDADRILNESLQFSKQEAQNREHSCSNFTTGQTIAGGSVFGSNASYGCLVEIENDLLGCLERPSVHFKKGTDVHPHPQKVAPSTKSLFSISNSLGTQGLVAYNIAGTDIDIAIFVCVTPVEYYFSIAFLPTNRGTDENLMNYLSDKNGWRTRPDVKWARAHEGERVVEMRNVRMKARMTVAKDDRASLKVFVTAL